MELFHPQSQIVQKLLYQDSGSLFTDPLQGLEWPIYAQYLPEGEAVKDNAAAVLDSTGVVLARLSGSRRNLESFGIQVITRGFDKRTSFLKAHRLCKILEVTTRVQVTLDGITYTVDDFKQTSPVASIGEDQRRRSKHTVNFLVMFIA